MTCELTREVVADLRISGLVSQMDAMIRRGVKPERYWLLELNRACHARREIRKENKKEAKVKTLEQRLEASLARDIELAREDARRFHVIKSAGRTGYGEICDDAQENDGDFEAAVDRRGALMLREFCGKAGAA